MKIEWHIQFWDFGNWNCTSEVYQYKSQAVEEARRLNKKTSHTDRFVYEGHRFRVREFPKRGEK